MVLVTHLRSELPLSVRLCLFLTVFFCFALVPNICCVVRLNRVCRRTTTSRETQNGKHLSATVEVNRRCERASLNVWQSTDTRLPIVSGISTGEAQPTHGLVLQLTSVGLLKQDKKCHVEQARRVRREASELRASEHQQRSAD